MLFRSLLSLSTVENALGPFPGFNTSNEEDSLDDDNGPLPRDTGVLENYMVDDWDVEGWEDCDETSDDGPEKERIAPDIVRPLGEVFFTTGLHAEERSVNRVSLGSGLGDSYNLPSHVDHFPSEKESEPGETNESS